MTRENKNPKGTLQPKAATALQRLACSQAAIRHAMYALRLGRNVEAYAVLKANTEDIHFSWNEVDRLVALVDEMEHT